MDGKQELRERDDMDEERREEIGYETDSNLSKF